MWEIVFVILVVVVVMFFSVRLRRKKLRPLPDASDLEFIKMFEEEFSGLHEEAVIKERNNLAKILGMPEQKLSPRQTFDDLSNHLNFLGSYDLAIGDLEEEVSGLFERAKVPKPYKQPSTVGELIFEMVKAKEPDAKNVGVSP